MIFQSSIPRKRRRDGEILSAAGVAAMLERSTTWFYKKLPDLQKEGFPTKDAVLGGWIRSGVKAWLDQRAGVAANSNVPSRLTEALDED